METFSGLQDGAASKGHWSSFVRAEACCDPKTKLRSRQSSFNCSLATTTGLAWTVKNAISNARLRCWFFATPSAPAAPKWCRRGHLQGSISSTYAG